MKKAAFVFCISMMVTAVAIQRPLFAQQAAVSSSREFQFSYAAEVVGAEPGSEVAVWFPIAQPSSNQEVRLLEVSVPAALQISTESRYGNKIGFFRHLATEAPVQLKIQYRVLRREARTAPPAQLSQRDRQLYLAPNAKVPVTGRPLELLSGQPFSTQPAELGKQLYDLVEQHMRYDKSKPGFGSGDAVWACDSQFGNCTDFHSLFISLMRSRQVPSRFEIGFPLPVEKGSGAVGGYHCWAWFHVPNRGWIPVDISEADKNPAMKEYYFGNLTPDRVQFTTGRDIRLVPSSEGQPLNYFIYPHVEVNGKTWPKDKIKFDFSFADSKPSN